MYDLDQWSHSLCGQGAPPGTPKCLWSARGQNEGSFPPDAWGGGWLRASYHAAGSGTRVTSVVAPPRVVAVLLQLPGKENAPRAAWSTWLQAAGLESP